MNALEDFSSDRIIRIVTTDFPQYFAIVTRIRQEVHAIGPEGGILSSTVVPQVQAIFPEGALTKTIKVGLQVGGTSATATKTKTTGARRRNLSGTLNRLFHFRSTSSTARKEVETAAVADVVGNAAGNAKSTARRGVAKRNAARRREPRDPMTEYARELLYRNRHQIRKATRKRWWNRWRKNEPCLIVLQDVGRGEQDDDGGGGLFSFLRRKKNQRNDIPLPPRPRECSLTSSVVSFGWDIVDQIDDDTGLVTDRYRVPYVRRRPRTPKVSPPHSESEFVVSNLDNNNPEAEDVIASPNASDSAKDVIPLAKDKKPKSKDSYILSACLSIFFPRVLRYAQLL